jgi:hypothetical protein
MLLTLAPLSQSIDMFIAIAFCFIPPFIWFYYGYKASKSGSIYKKGRENMPGYYEWAESDINVSFWKTAHFYIGVTWLILGTIFFFALLWPDHADVWFVN